MIQPKTLKELLSCQAQSQPDRVVFTYLGDGENPAGAGLTFAQLDLRARAIAAHLLEQERKRELDFGRGSPAPRAAILAFPVGIEFIEAFFGCIYAGMAAIPVYPSDLLSAQRAREALLAIAEDSHVRLILTDDHDLSAIIRRDHANSANSAESADPPESVPCRPDKTAKANIVIVSTRQVCRAGPGLDDLSDSYRAPKIRKEDLAIIQYTSGSTTTPKGVLLTHENVLSNQAMIMHAFQHTQESATVSWLPVGHDMGLIGSILQPVFVGFPCVFMSPLHFLARPARWLNAISRFGATTSGGPNFAYDLCVKKVKDEHILGLDLSGWQVAFNGAEPVRAETISSFTDRFSPFRFSRSAFFPCYGLAEATLFVSGTCKSNGPAIIKAEPEALAGNRLDTAPDNAAQARALVSCGQPSRCLDVAIVDPLTRRKLAPDEVGEIWIAGASVAKGFHNRALESRKTFHARLKISNACETIDYLRTGDLGFLHENELFVVGRIKDLIVVNGRNIYPQDIELTIEKAHVLIRPGGCGAVSFDSGKSEQIVVVVEINQPSSASAGTETGLNAEVFAQITDAIASSVTARLFPSIYETVIVAAGVIPKTSSGKIRRHLLKDMYLQGRLPALWSSQDRKSSRKRR